MVKLRWDYSDFLWTLVPFLLLSQFLSSIPQMFALEFLKSDSIFITSELLQVLNLLKDLFDYLFLICLGTSFAHVFYLKFWSNFTMLILFIFLFFGFTWLYLREENQFFNFTTFSDIFGLDFFQTFLSMFILFLSVVCLGYVFPNNKINLFYFCSIFLTFLAYFGTTGEMQFNYFLLSLGLFLGIFNNEEMLVDRAFFFTFIFILIFWFLKINLLIHNQQYDSNSYDSSSETFDSSKLMILLILSALLITASNNNSFIIKKINNIYLKAFPCFFYGFITIYLFQTYELLKYSHDSNWSDFLLYGGLYFTAWLLCFIIVSLVNFIKSKIDKKKSFQQKLVQNETNLIEAGRNTERTNIEIAKQPEKEKSS